MMQINNLLPFKIILTSTIVYYKKRKKNVNLIFFGIFIKFKLMTGYTKNLKCSLLCKECKIFI